VHGVHEEQTLDDSAPRGGTFHSFAESTAEDWRRPIDPADDFALPYAERVLALLGQLAGSTGGFAVDRLQHCLQTATRAHRASRDEEYVVCALLHDVGDVFCPSNHADMAAAMLRPYVSEQNHWLVAHHTVFQGYYYFHHLGMDRNLRDHYRGHPYFAATAEFCHLFDQVSFDPGYDTLPLAAFEPMLRRVMARPKRAVLLPEDGGAGHGLWTRLGRALRLVSG
jgi:predicted HD phosphohydrolase